MKIESNYLFHPINVSCLKTRSHQRKKVGMRKLCRQELPAIVALSHVTRKVNQEDLNELVRALSLSKEDAYTTATLLRQFEVLDPATKATYYRNREQEYSCYCEIIEDVVYCKDIVRLLKKLDMCNTAEEVSSNFWLFIDGSKSVKAFLLHVENELPEVPVTYTRKAEESYEIVQLILTATSYDEYKWKCGGDLKIIGFLTGSRRG